MITVNASAKSRTISTPTTVTAVHRESISPRCPTQRRCATRGLLSSLPRKRTSLTGSVFSSPDDGGISWDTGTTRPSASRCPETLQAKRLGGKTIHLFLRAGQAEPNQKQTLHQLCTFGVHVSPSFSLHLWKKHCNTCHSYIYMTSLSLTE